MPLLGVVGGLSSVDYDLIVYLYAKFDDSSVNSSRDIIGVPKIEVCHVTLATLFKGD